MRKFLDVIGGGTIAFVCFAGIAAILNVPAGAVVGWVSGVGFWRGLLIVVVVEVGPMLLMLVAYLVVMLIGAMMRKA